MLRYKYSLKVDLLGVPGKKLQARHSDLPGNWEQKEKKRKKVREVEAEEEEAKEAKDNWRQGQKWQGARTNCVACGAIETITSPTLTS